jgi:hypothetical protein
MNFYFRRFVAAPTSTTPDVSRAAFILKVWNDDNWARQDLKYRR